MIYEAMNDVRADAAEAAERTMAAMHAGVPEEIHVSVQRALETRLDSVARLLAARAK